MLEIVSCKAFLHTSIEGSAVAGDREDPARNKFTARLDCFLRGYHRASNATTRTKNRGMILGFLFQIFFFDFKIRYTRTAS